MREAQITEPATHQLIEVTAIGIVATLVTDIWQRLLQVLAGVPSPQWGLIGRWVAGFPSGVFVHRSIAASKSVRGELALGWAFHYAAGIAWAAAYVAIMRLVLGSGPTLISALAISLALLATRTGHGRNGFAYAEARRGSCNECADARSVRHRSLPGRDWLGLVGLDGICCPSFRKHASYDGGVERCS